MNYMCFFMLSNYVLGFDPGQYDHKQIMWNATGEVVYSIHWSLVGKTINIALEVKTAGWVGFGIAEQNSGGMAGSDIVQGYVAESAVEIQDSYALGQLSGGNVMTAPKKDACNHWTLISGEENGGKTILELSRLIDTEDSQDRPILLNTVTKIIMAYGDDDAFGFQHPQSQRKASFINFSGEEFVDPLQTYKDDPSVASFDFLIDYTITTNKTKIDEFNAINHPLMEASLFDPATTYIDRYIAIPPEMVNGGDFHIIGIEHVIIGASIDYVHHLLVDGVTASGEKDRFYAWASGVSPLVMKKCGYRGSEYTHLFIQVHYDNPRLQEGHRDNSGVKIFFTREMLPYDCGFTHFGDLKVALMWKDPSLPLGKSRYDFDCPGFQSQLWALANVSEINIVASMPHMHVVGRQMWTERYRDGNVLTMPDRIDFWDNNFQNLRRYEDGEEFIIKEGDAFKTTCIFDVNSAWTFGLGTLNEMCIHFIVYYPKVQGMDFGCNFDSNENVTLTKASITEFVRDFGNSNDASCPTDSATDSVTGDMGSSVTGDMGASATGDTATTIDMRASSIYDSTAGQSHHYVQLSILIAMLFAF